MYISLILTNRDFEMNHYTCYKANAPERPKNNVSGLFVAIISHLWLQEL